MFVYNNLRNCYTTIRIIQQEVFTNKNKIKLLQINHNSIYLFDTF